MAEREPEVLIVHAPDGEDVAGRLAAHLADATPGLGVVRAEDGPVVEQLLSPGFRGAVVAAGGVDLERLRDLVAQASMAYMDEVEPEASEAALEGLAVGIAFELLTGHGRVSAAELAAEFLRVAPQPANGLAQRVHVAPREGAPRKPVQQWREEVRRLFRDDLVPELEDRHLIRGLVLLEPALTKDLLEHGFLNALDAEFDPPLDELLTEAGKRLLEPGEVPAHADRPAEVDELEREVFARALARMIDDGEVRRSGEPFLVHLHGPWGSGKSSLLRFLAAALDEDKKKKPRDERWVVVEFNAWQHERLGPPWWAMMRAIYKEARREVSLPRKVWLTALRAWWRLSAAIWWLVLLVLLAALVWLGIDRGFFDGLGDRDKVATMGDWAKALGAVASLLGLLVGLLVKLVRAAPGASARGADAFVRGAPDPMQLMAERFTRLIAVVDRRVVVFVEDLDRCQAEFVVELLHGIQTILIGAPVAYVVAADRRWLYDSYAKVYADFTSLGDEPGRPMAHLFLEKTFQLSAAMPQVSAAVHDRYWRRLVDGKPPHRRRPVEPAGARVVAKLKGAGLDEVIETGTAASGMTGRQRRAVVEAASERAAAPDVRREIEHRLAPFAPLLERNPRAMKRLVNAYRIELQRLLVEGRRVGGGAVTPEQVALWTILSLRWPLLADELAAHPERAEAPPEAGSPLADPTVRAVIAGDAEGVHAKLTEQAIRALVGLDQRSASVA